MFRFPPRRLRMELTRSPLLWSEHPSLFFQNDMYFTIRTAVTPPSRTAPLLQRWCRDRTLLSPFSLSQELTCPEAAMNQYFELETSPSKAATRSNRLSSWTRTISKVSSPRRWPLSEPVRFPLFIFSMNFEEDLWYSCSHPP